jgi:hypothetical protein
VTPKNGGEGEESVTVVVTVIVTVVVLFMLMDLLLWYGIVLGNYIWLEIGIMCIS